MKILFVHPNNDYTGSSKVLQDVIRNDYHNDFCVVLTINESDGFLTDIDGVKIYNISFLRISGRPIPIFSSLFSLIDRVVKFVRYAQSVDLIYINTIKPYYAAWLSQIMHKKILWHIHEKFSKRSFGIRIMEYTQRHTQAHFIFVSKYVRNQYRLSPNSTFEIRYNKLSKDFISAISIRPLYERKKTNLLMASGLTVVKGIYNYVELARLLPDYNFNLVLSCSDKEKEEFVNTVSPPSNVNVWARQKSMHTHYYNADVIMNMTIPSMCVETFGMTILEGMAYGLPAIVPNVGGPLELVHNGVEGYAIDVCDFNDLKKAIIRITSDKSTYEKFSKAALNRSYEFR